MNVMAQPIGELTDRMREIFGLVVDAYLERGLPIGSRVLAGSVNLSPASIRGVMQELEERGLLTHPHTSAGRIPTETGYRVFADDLLEHVDPQPREFPLDLTAAQSEIEAALQATTEMLSQVNRLLALVSAPPLEATTV